MGKNDKNLLIIVDLLKVLIIYIQKFYNINLNFIWVKEI